MKDVLLFPRYLSIQTTSMCNASCVFCPHPAVRDLFPHRIMSMPLYKKIIDECSGYKDIERIILYMNNEPLTDPDIIKRIDCAKEKVPWAKVHILTNGLLLTDEMADKLLKSSLDWIGISFHGIRKDTIERSTGIDYDIALERINNFINKAGSCKNLKDYLMLTFIKHRYLTLEEKKETEDYWRSKGIERISSFDGPISRAGNVQDLPAVHNREKIVGCASIWADEMIHIVEDGKVVLCCMDWKREVILGDLNNESIFEIWNKKRKETWKMILGKSSMPDKFLCRHCEESIVEKAIKNEVLLILLPPWGVDTPYLGLACLSTSLMRADIPVEVFDMNIELYNIADKRYKYLWHMNYSYWWRKADKYPNIREKLDNQIEGLIKKILASPQRIAGFSLPTNCSDLLLEEIVRRVKERDPEKIIILGGVSVSIREQRSDLLGRIEPYVDYCVAGEGEDILCKLAEAIFNNKLDGIIKLKGVIKKHEFEEVNESAQIEDLNTLPFPSFDALDLKKYKVATSLPMEFSRGCVGQCPFCDFRSISPAFRPKQAPYLQNQIKFYKEQYGINHLSLCDAAVNGDVKVLAEVCDLLIKDNVSINISALAIPRSEMTPDLLKKMKRAGFYRLEYGIESGSNKILKVMRKIFTKEIAAKVLKDTYEAGIETYLYFMVGYPGETEADFNETKEFLRKNARYITTIKSINPLYVMAGSELFCNSQKYGISFHNLQDKDREWFVGHENTSDIRKQRVLELKRLAMELKVHFTEEAEALECTLDSLGEKNISAHQVDNDIKVYAYDNTKTDIILAICPPWGHEMPPLGLAYLATFLKHNGFSAEVFDLNIEVYQNANKKIRELWKIESLKCWQDKALLPELLDIFNDDINHFVEKLVNSDSQFIGFSVNEANIILTIEVVKKIKSKCSDKIIIFGGPGCYWGYYKNQDLPSGIYDYDTDALRIIPGMIDVFVRGEGEYALLDVLTAYKNNLSKAIPGTIAFEHGRYINHGLRTPTKNLDDLPYPTFEEFDLGKYSKEIIPLYLSRGCINKCSFCNDHVISVPYRTRSPKYVMEEILFHYQNGARSFFFCDLLVNGNLKYLEQLCGLIVSSNINIDWTAQAVIRKGMNASLLQKLRDSGCGSLVYGVESFSDNVLKIMNKSYTPEDAVEQLKNTQRAGIKTLINIIVGFPGESDNDFEVTKKTFNNYHMYIDEVSSAQICHLTPGSDIDINPDKYNIVRPVEGGWFKWSDEATHDYSIREKRLNELVDLIKNAKKKLLLTNLYEEKLEEEKRSLKDERRNESRSNKASEKRISEKSIANSKEAAHYDFMLVSLPPWAQENPHIGIGYLNSYLRSNNVSAMVMDLNKSFYLSHPDFRMLWHVENKSFWSNEDTFPLILEIFKVDIENAVNEIIKYDCDILGFSVIDPKERLTIEFIKRIKEKFSKTKIILGGPATSTQEQRKIFLDNINNYIDAFVVGEGEETLFHLVESIKNKRDIKNVAGCFVKNNEKWVYKERKPIMPLDKTPFPTYEEFDMTLYGKSLLVEWSRGCIGKCAFCKNWRLSSSYRSRSADNIVSELIYHSRINGVNDFTVTDNILNGDLGNLEKVCDKIVEKKLKIKWTGQIAPRKEMSYNIFKKMKHAGCYKLQIGLESASDKVLRLMHKTFTADISEQNIRSAKKAGIETEIFVMIGFPGENDYDFNRTYNFIKRNQFYINTIKSINTLHLVAGTEVFEKGSDSFGMKSLPRENWHYLWETRKGNTYKIRNKRAKALVSLAGGLGIRVMETNVAEGKERTFKISKEKNALCDNVLLLKKSIQSLQVLPQGEKDVKKRRSLSKKLILVFVTVFILAYIIYFWTYMLLSSKILLGGKRR